MKKSLIMVLALCVAAAMLLSACGQAKKPEATTVPESAAEEVSEAVSEAAEEVTEAVSEVVEEVTDAAEEAKEEASEIAEEITDAAEEVKEEAADAAEEVKEEASEAVEEVKEEVSDTAEEVKEESSEVVEEVKEEAVDTAEEVKEEAASVVEDAKDKAEEVVEDVKDKAEEVKEEAAAVVEEAKDKVEEIVEDVTAEAEEAELTVPMTYAEYAAAEIDDEVFVEVYVQNHQSWWEDKITVYAADKDGAYFIYEMACSEEDAAKLVPGTKILVRGYKAEWSGEVEIADATFEFAEEDGEGYIAEAEDITELLGKDELIDHMNEFVSFKGLTIEPSKDADEKEAPFLYNWDGSGTQGDDLYFNASVNGETFTFTVESYLCDKDTDVYKAVEALKAGDVVDLEGFLYWYNGANPHITSVTVVK